MQLAAAVLPWYRVREHRMKKLAGLQRPGRLKDFYA